MHPSLHQAPLMRPSLAPTLQEPAKAEEGEAEEEEVAKSEDYTKDMQKKMGTSLTYRHEDGINWHSIMPDLVVGSCLQVRCGGVCVRMGACVYVAGGAASIGTPSCRAWWRAPACKWGPGGGICVGKWS